MSGEGAHPFTTAVRQAAASVVSMPEPQERNEQERPLQQYSEVGDLFAMVSQFGPAPSPIAEKITPEHISAMLEIDRARIGNEHLSEKDQRRFLIIVFGMLGFFVLAMLYVLLATGNDQLTEKVLTGFFSLIAGFLGGFGVGRAKKS